MQYANAVEAAKLLDVNERTIRRWLYRGLLGRVIDEHGEVIAESRIPAIEPVQKLNERRFSIPLHNIQILSDRMGRTTITELDLRLTELEAVVKRQAEQISVFLKLLNEPDKQRTPVQDISKTKQEHRPDTRPVLAPLDRTPTPDNVVVLSDPNDLPDDAVPLFKVADMNDINRRTLVDFVLKHHFPCYRLQHPTRVNERPIYVTQEQQSVILAARQK